MENLELNALSVYDNRYIKNKIRAHTNKNYTNFHGQSGPEDGVECESFPVISIDSLLVYDRKYYLQIYLD